jgi:MoaA/NifB/PqqE/SkfB family radical SAM enzyme
MLRKRLKQLRFLRNPSIFRRVVTSEIKMRLGVPTLRSLEFAVTWACNKQCPFCYAEDLMVSPDRNKEPIAIAKFKEVVLQARELGLVHINITGGEPFVRKDLFDLVASIPKDIVITIVTNNLLLTKERIDRLKGLGVASLQLSYGKNYENDFNLNMARYIKNKGIEVCLSIVNIEEEREVNERAMKIAIENGFFVLFNYPMKLKLDKSFYWKYRSHPIVREDNLFWAGKNRCPAGVEKLYVTNDGQIMICDRIHDVVGSIYKEPLKDIWKGITKVYNKKDRPFCMLQSCEASSVNKIR